MTPSPQKVAALAEHLQRVTAVGGPLIAREAADLIESLLADKEKLAKENAELTREKLERGGIITQSVVEMARELGQLREAYDIAKESFAAEKSRADRAVAELAEARDAFRSIADAGSRARQELYAAEDKLHNLAEQLALEKMSLEPILNSRESLRGENSRLQVHVENLIDAKKAAEAKLAAAELLLREIQLSPVTVMIADKIAWHFNPAFYGLPVGNALAQPATKEDSK